MSLKMHINKKLFQKYMDNPPIRFECDNGTIVLNKNLVKNILLSIQHLTQELDAMILFVGSEGTGKSLFMRQILYVFWWFLKKFEMVDYDYDLNLLHFGIKELQEDRVKYDLELDLKFRISNLDESKDDLGRDKHNNPETQDFLNYLRRCRDECGILALAQPQISEFLPSIVLSRALLIFDVSFDLDDETGDIVRGDYSLITIPRGRLSHSSYHNKYLAKQYIKITLGEHLHNPKQRYADIPDQIISHKGNFNAVDPCNKKHYLKKKKEKKWERLYKKKDELSNLRKEVHTLRKHREYFLKLLEFVKVLHQDRGVDRITDKDVAKAIGVSPRTVSTYIREYKGIES